MIMRNADDFFFGSLSKLSQTGRRLHKGRHAVASDAVQVAGIFQI
jgi:hypothetical protein